MPNSVTHQLDTVELGPRGDARDSRVLHDNVRETLHKWGTVRVRSPGRETSERNATRYDKWRDDNDRALRHAYGSVRDA